MKILVIDNYDSFTFNLVQYLGELGAASDIVRNDEIDTRDVESRGADAIVISPGPCTPTEAGISVPVIQSYAGRLPMLGVCLGHQAIGQAFGGKIVPAKTLMHGKTSPIGHNDKGIFKGLPGGFAATRYHSLAVDRASLPDELEVTAGAPDGEIMGLAHRSLPVWGVQFHPESILTVVGRHLLGNFLKLAARQPL